MILRNYMEAIVFDMINMIIDKFDCCTCERCRYDVAAYALNNLPPKYIVTNELFAKLDVLHSQFGINVMTQVTVGVEKVKANPRH